MKIHSKKSSRKDDSSEHESIDSENEKTDCELSEKERQLQRNAEILRMTPDNIADALAKARFKPIWCSDIRWRMELRRRKSFRYGY